METTQKTPQLARLAKKDWLFSALLGLLAFIVYCLTLTPSLSFISPDGSELATIPAILGLAHMPGYPLYTWLGYLFSKVPLGDVAHRINLMSAFMGALGVSGLYLLIVQLLPGRNTWPGARTPGWLSGAVRRGCAGLAALLFAFSPTFWSQALIAEVYAVNTGMISLTLLALLRWERRQRARDFFLFALLFGLSTGTHISNLGFAPGFVIFILLTAWRVILNWRWWLSALGGFGLGILQYAWLPLQAAALSDRSMLRSAPNTLEGIYNYTFGAFSNLKFAFPLNQLPDRLVLYLLMLSEEFGWAAVFLGIVGLSALLFRRTRLFYLFTAMYLFHVWFFIQYKVFDLEVFFIPSHLIFVIFIAFGLRETLSLLGAGFGALFPIKNSAKSPLPAPARFFAGSLVLVLLLLPALAPLGSNWTQNDLSQDTAINDFYANIWEILPQDSVLLTQSGVFGYQAFYWQLIYNIRPDVTLPAMSSNNPGQDTSSDSPVFSTVLPSTQNGSNTLPVRLVGQNSWQIPLVLGKSSENSFNLRNQLVLYQITTQTPLVITQEQPQTELNLDLGPVSLVGAEISSQVESGGLVEVNLYWKINTPAAAEIYYPLIFRLGEEQLSRTTVGMGLLQRYLQSGLLQSGDVFIDHFYLVVPSLYEAGQSELNLQIINLQSKNEELSLGSIRVKNELEMNEGWLKITGVY